MTHTLEPIIALEKRLKRMNSTERNRALLGLYKDIFTGPLGKPVWGVNYTRADARNAAQMSIYLIENLEKAGFNHHAKKVYANLVALVSLPETFTSLDALSIEQAAEIMKTRGDEKAATQILNSSHYTQNALLIDAIGMSFESYPGIHSTTLSMGKRYTSQDSYEPLGWVVVLDGEFDIGQKLPRLPKDAVHVDRFYR